MVPAISSDPRERRKKWILTFSLYFMFMSYGVAFNILSSTRLDIARLLSVSFKDISVGLVFMSATYCPAALLFGFLFGGLINRQLALVGCLLSGGALVLSIPFFRSLPLLNTVQALMGVAGAGMDVGGNAWILEMWGEESGSIGGGSNYLSMVMQGYHFSFALGMTLIPLVTEPFLLPESEDNSTTVTVSPLVEEFTNSTGDHEWSFHGYGKDELFFAIPFGISTGVMWSAAIVLFTLFFRVPYQQAKRNVAEVKKSANHKECQCVAEDYSCQICISNNNHSMPKSYVIKVVILGSLLFAFYTGIEVNSFTFLQDFAYYSDLHVPKTTGALMLGVMAGTFAVGRGIGIFVASRVKTTYMLYTHLTIIGVGNGILFFLGNESVIGLWIASITMGYGYSCVFPTICSFLEERINVTDGITGCFIFFSATATVTNPLLIGTFIESKPMVFSYVNCISLVACWIIFLFLHSTDRLVNRSR